MLYSKYFQSGCIVGMLSTFVVGLQTASAEVNLEWQLDTSAKWFVGDTIEIGLYAVSSSSADQTVAGIDVILIWDPDVLELTGLNNNVVQQTILRDIFAMTMIVRLDDSELSVGQLQERLQEIAAQRGFEVTVRHEAIFHSMHRV